MMRWLGDLLTSRMFWEFRIVTAVLSIIIIWRGVIMSTELILYTPADYLPALVLIGLAVTGFFTVLKAKVAYNDATKDALRSGTITSAESYGLDYLATNVGNIIVGVVCTVFIPGAIYEMLSIEPNAAGCYVIGLVIALIIGIKGVTTFSEVADIFRDSGKISDLEAAASETTAESK